MSRTINQTTINLIKSFEGFFSKAYHGSLDPDNVDTIGYGTIKYPPTYMSGKAVRVGDPAISEALAVDFLRWEANLKAAAVEKLVKVDLTDNQFGALVSFAYNLGEGALADSTLLKRVNKNPNDPTIKDAFLMWVNAGPNKNVKGLVRRRTAEYDLYNTK